MPGWLPTTPGEDLRLAYEQIVATASQFADVPPRPFVLFVGGHTKGLDQVVTLLEDLPHFISGIYLQMTPVAPMKDGPSKLETLTSVYRHAASLGFKVIAGHAGAVTSVLRALGVDAADAGLAIGEGFDQSSTRRRAKPETEGTQQRGGRRSRMYFGQIGRSLEAVDVERLLAVPGAAAELRGCRLPCHRFSGHHLLGPESTRFGRGSRRRSSSAPCRRACGRRPSMNDSRASAPCSRRSTVPLKQRESSRWT